MRSNVTVVTVIVVAVTVVTVVVVDVVDVVDVVVTAVVGGAPRIFCKCVVQSLSMTALPSQ